MGVGIAAVWGLVVAVSVLCVAGLFLALVGERGERE